MSQHAIVPASIRPHLIPFLFKELEGKEACYEQRQVKSARFIPSSSLTKYLYTQLDYTKKRREHVEFVLYLTIDRKKQTLFTGHVYIVQNKITDLLHMPEDKVKDFNNLIEDIFRIATLYFIEGCVSAGTEVTTAINQFIDKYDLLEAGFDSQAIRQLYYRDKDENRLNRLQSQSSNRVYNYSG